MGMRRLRRRDCWEGIMRSTSRSGMLRSARVLAGGLLALGLGVPSFAQPPAPSSSPYALQPPKSNGDPKPASLKADQPPAPPAESKKEETGKPKVMIGPCGPAPAPVAAAPPAMA